MNTKIEKYARFSDTVLKQKNIDVFASQEALRVAGSKREYQFDGAWAATNPGKRPDATRVVVELEAFKKARASYFAWKDLSPLFAFDPVFPEIIIRRLSQPAITLFIPWGVRNASYITGKEYEAMDQIDMARSMLQKRNIKTQVLLMPADLYAVEVNRLLEPKNVYAYFDQVKKEGEQRGYTVTPWSSIRSDNQGMYDTLAAQYTDDALQTLLPNPVIESARRAAEKIADLLTRKALRGPNFDIYGNGSVKQQSLNRYGNRLNYLWHQKTKIMLLTWNYHDSMYYLTIWYFHGKDNYEYRK